MNKREYFKALSEIVSSLKIAQQVATAANDIGIKNISQPGIIKEVIMASQLKHRLHATKKEHDAEDFSNPNKRYEYLSCLEGKSFQFDRVDKENLKSRVLRRNTKIYCGVFDKNNPLELKKIYEVNPYSLWKIFEIKYKKSKSSSRHVGITEKEILELNKFHWVFPKTRKSKI